MAAEYTGKRNYNVQLLDELEALSHSLYHSHTSTSTTRRTASLALPRTSVPAAAAAAPDNDDKQPQLNPKPRSRRMSLSPWRSRPKPNDSADQAQPQDTSFPNKDRLNKLDDGEKAADASDRKGLWSWKPIRALSHIGMQKLSCLFSVEVVAVQGLPLSMNGLRLSVRVRKKETKDGAVQTMPSRVQQGAADFEETLFIRCHVYFTPASGTHMKFEPRPFLIYVFAVDAGELDFGRSSVDLSHLIQDSIEKSFQGTRVKQWDTSFNLSGKAKGGELVLKLGFQIMEKDGGIGIYSQSEGQKSGKNKSSSSSIARKQSKSSFSVPSPKLSSRAEAWTPSQTGARADLQDIDDLNLDEPAPAPTASPPSRKPHVPDAKIEDDLPDFEVVDKGVEIQEDNNGNEEEAPSRENSEKRSVSGEVVKEIVHEQFHLARLSELDSIAQRIKALESMMKEEKAEKTDEDTESQRLDAEEETVRREFLQMLEDSEGNELKKPGDHEIPQLKLEGDEDSGEAESKVYIPDLGKGLGCIVQTRNGGYLAAMNPLDTAVARRDTPKLAMQVSRPVIVPSKATTGFELLQRMAAVGFDELGSEILSLMPVDELKGKTAEQIAFEGIASAIIQGRNKGGASSSAARTLASVKSMATALSTGRKERISTGIWNLSEEPVVVDEILAFSMQKLEAMAVEALKVQADIAEEEAPFDVSPLSAKLSGEQSSHLLASAIPLEEDWIIRRKGVGNGNGDPETMRTIAVVVQLRDPLRQYEAVGGPMIALIHSSSADAKPAGNYDEEKTFKVVSLQVGGLKAGGGGRKTQWDSEKQRLTAMQWVVAYGLGKAAGKKGKRQASKGQDILWSISSRVMAGMWLKAIRNPDVKFAK